MMPMKVASLPGGEWSPMIPHDAYCLNRQLHAVESFLRESHNTKHWRWRTLKISASLMCANPLDIGADVRSLIHGGIDQWHIDIMDGRYVPNLALNFDLVKALKQFHIPMDVHLMVENPDPFVTWAALAGAEMISVHLEQMPFAFRTVAKIKEAGAKAGIAVNPSTDLNRLKLLLPEIDYVLLMAVEPGFAGQTFIPTVYDKITQVRKWADEIKPSLGITVDGSINVETARHCLRLGADTLVAGTSSIFRKQGSIGHDLIKFREQIS